MQAFRLTPIQVFFCAYCELLSILKNICDGCFWLFFYFSNLFVSAVSVQLWSKTMVTKLFIEIRLCNPMTYNFKSYFKTVEIYILKFNVSVLNRFKITGFFVNANYIRKYNVIWNKTVTKIFTILTKCFSPYLNPTSYLKKLGWCPIRDLLRVTNSSDHEKVWSSDFLHATTIINPLFHQVIVSHKVMVR